MRIGVAVAILVGMWIVMRFVTAPGAPAGVTPMEFETKRWLFCRWVDVNFLTTAHRAEGGFTVITMIALGFTAWLSLTNLVSGTTDTLTAKMARTAVSAAFPMVGRILSDAAATVTAAVWSGSPSRPTKKVSARL